MSFSLGVGGKSDCHPYTHFEGGNMKKLLVVVCVILGVAILGSFAYTLHFTATHSCKTNNGGDVSQDCGHDAQIQQLMREIEIRQDRIKDLEQTVNFYYDVLAELLDMFDIQYEWIEELLGQTFYYQELLNQANAEILELTGQIAELKELLANCDCGGD